MRTATPPLARRRVRYIGNGLSVWATLALAAAGLRGGVRSAGADDVSGDPAAQFQLGNRYFDERDRDPVKDAEAQKWLRLSAAPGYAPAEDRLASIYYFGRGVPQDYSEAARWYRLAAEHGNTDAMTRLGSMYRDGKGMPRDRNEERKWFNKGNAIATQPVRRRAYLGFGIAIAAAAAFAAGMLALQRNMLSRRPRFAVAIAVDAVVRSFATTLRNWQMFNLIWTFMGMIGLVFHALAIWYVVYVIRRIRFVKRGGGSGSGSGNGTQDQAPHLSKI